MPNIEYAIEVLTGTSTTDADIGLKSGTFGFITGDPSGVFSWGGNEEQSGTIGVYDPGDAASSDHNFYTNLIVKDGISKAGRRIDISGTGDYGTLSGFNFSIINDAFWKELETQDIPIIKRKVIFYVVIDNVFYQQWTGEVTNNPYNETDYKFVCKDRLKSLHRNFPPEVINDTNYPNAIKSSAGKPIPVSFGDISKAQLFNVSGSPSWLKLCTISGIEYENCAAVTSGGTDAYSYSSKKAFLNLYTWGKTFAADELANNYIFVIAGGGSPDTEKGTKIIGNTATTGLFTLVELETPIDATPTVFNASYAYTQGSAPTTDVWWFKIADLEVQNVLSTKQINAYKLDSESRFKLYEYEDNKYNLIENILTDYSVGDAGNLPKVDVLSGNITKDGEISTYEMIKPITVSKSGTPFFVTGYTGDVDSVIDRDRSTTYDIAFDTDTGVYFIQDFTLTLPNDIAYGDYDAIYMMIDFEFTGTAETAYMVNSRFPSDIYGALYSGVVDTITWVSAAKVVDTITWPYALTDLAADTDYNILPNIYYKPTEGDNGETSQFGTIWTAGGTDYKTNDQFELSSDITNLIKKDLASNRIRIRIQPFFSGTTTGTFKIKQIGFVGVKTIDLTSQDLYTSVEGELVGASETNSVYHAIKHILETYDEIDSSEIDYGNLETVRGTGNADYFWHLGRQVVERKNSFEYIKQLCQASLVGCFPNRFGYRAFSAWLEDTANAVDHNKASITRGSIRRWVLTDISKLFNDFYIKYGWNPGAKDYDKAFIVTNTDRPQFPTNINNDMTSNTASDQKDIDVTDGSVFAVGDIITVADDDNSERAIVGAIAANTLTVETNLVNSYTTAANGYVVGRWEEYFGGLNSTSYGDAKSVWDKAKAAYDLAETIQEMPESLAALPWYPDHSDFDASELIYQGTGSSAFKFLKQAVEWVSRQKTDSEYSVPLDAVSAELELLNYVNFNDAIYTDGVTVNGWVSMIEVNPATDQLNVRTTIEPQDWAELTGDIIESGAQTDTITESGAQSDTYTETGTN